MSWIPWHAISKKTLASSYTMLHMQHTTEDDERWRIVCEELLSHSENYYLTPILVVWHWRMILSLWRTKIGMWEYKCINEEQTQKTYPNVLISTWALSMIIEDGFQLGLMLWTLWCKARRIGRRSCSRVHEMTKKAKGVLVLQSSNTITV